MNAPLAYDWDGEVMRPCRPQLADKLFVVGERYRLVEAPPRSRESHDHYFARLHEIWDNLPEHLTDEFHNDERLRKRALIATGWFTERRIVCSSAKEAAKFARFLNAGDIDDRVISIAGPVIIERTARSQKLRGDDAMNKQEFQQSKQDVLEWCETLLQPTERSHETQTL